MRRNIFNHGYHVSAAEREEQIRRETANVAQYDARLLLPELPAECDGTIEPWDMAAFYADWAKSMGCEGATLRALIDYIEADKSPLYDGLPDPGRDWYRIGKDACDRIEATYGSRIYSIEKTKALRSTSIRRIRDAHKALA
jgi:hypothetical protein